MAPASRRNGFGAVRPRSTCSPETALSFLGGPGRNPHEPCMSRVAPWVCMDSHGLPWKSFLIDPHEKPATKGYESKMHDPPNRSHCSPVDKQLYLNKRSFPLAYLCCATDHHIQLHCFAFFSALRVPTSRGVYLHTPLTDRARPTDGGSRSKVKRLPSRLFEFLCCLQMHPNCKRNNKLPQRQRGIALCTTHPNCGANRRNSVPTTNPGSSTGKPMR